LELLETWACDFSAVVGSHNAVIISFTDNSFIVYKENCKSIGCLLEDQEL